jgi:sugar/nucleoside kinase (ribokinase family)
LLRKNINLDSLNHYKEKSFHWEGEYKGDMNIAITTKTVLGVLLNFKPKITPEQRRIKHVFLANTDPDIQISLLKQLHSPQLVALDTMNFWINNKRKSLLNALRMVDVFVVNDQEARSLTGESNTIKAAHTLRRMGPAMIMLKKGEHGSLLHAPNFDFMLPAWPASRVVDPTGAGDTFAGAFMGYLARAKKVNQAHLKKAVAYGTIAASFNIEGFGVEKTAKLTRNMLDKRLKNFRDKTLF